MAKPETKKKFEAILFECRAPAAKHVFLAGTFNNWDTKALPMEKAHDGRWRAQLDLPAGRYEFKFLVDDCWCCEPGTDERSLLDCVLNEFGTMNRVIHVLQE